MKISYLKPSLRGGLALECRGGGGSGYREKYHPSEGRNSSSSIKIINNNINNNTFGHLFHVLPCFSHISLPFLFYLFFFTCYCSNVDSTFYFKILD